MLTLSDRHLQKIIEALYTSLLGRKADMPGLAYWVGSVKSGASIERVLANFLESEEFSRRQQEEGFAEEIIGRVQVALSEISNLLVDLPIGIVDLGAQNLENEEHIYAPLLRSGLPCNTIGFEPLEHRRLERMAQASDSNLILLPDFIGDGQTHVFHINEPDATSSLFPLNEDVISRLYGLETLRTVRTELVSTSLLDHALNQLTSVDFLKLDIQGGELLALQGAEEILKKALVVHCEVEFVEIYKGQALFSEVELQMRSAGYDLVDLQSLCRYPLAKSSIHSSREVLGWADAVFFRRLDETAAWRELLLQSAIALLVYDKPSLASELAQKLPANCPAHEYRAALVMPENCSDSLST